MATRTRCRCRPSWRGRRWNAQTGRAEWQSPSTKERAEVLSWLAATRRGAQHLAEVAAAGRTFEAIGDDWLDGVEAGRMGRRRGRGKPHSETTIENYRRSYRHFIRSEFGSRVADEIGEAESQVWVDRLSREGLSRSRIAGHVSVASAIYAWGMSPSRRYATRNPLRLVELPPRDEKPRLRVALAPEAAQLLAALREADAVPYAIAFYAAYAVLRSTASNRRRSSRATRSRAACWSRARRARRAGSARRRSPSRSESSSRRHGSAKAAEARTRVRAQRDVRGTRRAGDRGVGRRGPRAHHASRVPAHVCLPAGSMSFVRSTA